MRNSSENPSTPNISVNETIDRFLQPLRIPAGWIISYNIFTEFDPIPENMSYFFGEWLFAAIEAHGKLGIEVRFEPEGDANGMYVIDTYRLVGREGRLGNEQSMLNSYSTQSRKDVVQIIETFLATRTNQLPN